MFYTKNYRFRSVLRNEKITFIVAKNGIWGRSNALKKKCFFSVRSSQKEFQVISIEAILGFSFKSDMSHLHFTILYCRQSRICLRFKGVLQSIKYPVTLLCQLCAGFDEEQVGLLIIGRLMSSPPVWPNFPNYQVSLPGTGTPSHVIIIIILIILIILCHPDKHRHYCDCRHLSHGVRPLSSSISINILFLFERLGKGEGNFYQFRASVSANSYPDIYCILCLAIPQIVP